jgi:helicase
MHSRSSVLPEPDEVDVLRLVGFEPAFIRAVKKCAGERLLPVQQRALEEGLFEGRNLVVMSPTASGKGLVGELACLREAQENRRALYLVPSRALATEKFAHLRDTYGPLGVRAAVSSSDHRQFDESILAGDYHIGVIVYEKVRYLLVQRPDLMDEVGVVVVDELQNLFDEERGPGLEFLLTSIRDSSAQMIGLSAVLGNREVADWLAAELVVETQRPVELRQGVLSEGIFRYREYNTHEEGEEAFVGIREDVEWGVVSQTAIHLAERRGESVLVFVATREESFALAAKMAEVSSLRPATRALEELEFLEPTAAVAFLQQTLARGIAVHNSDLTAEERAVVERSVRTEEVRIVCATTTLSEGVNLPVVNTFVPRRVYRGVSRPVDGYGRARDPVPLSRCEYQNMTGRSGRPGLPGGCEFGRGIMLASSRADASALFQHYVDGSIDPLPLPSLAAGLGSFILEYLARKGPTTEEELVSLFAGSLSGIAWSRDHTGDKVARVLGELGRMGLVTVRDDKWETETDGRLIGLHGFRAETGVLFRGFLGECDPDRTTQLDLLLLACLAPESEMVRVPVSRSEWKKGALEREFLRLVDEGEIGSWIAERCGYVPEAGSVTIGYRAAMALKKALLLEGYANGVAVCDLERRHQIRFGLIQRLAERTAWLLRALVELAHLSGWPTPDHERIGTLADSVRLGLPEEAFGMIPLVEAGMARTHVLALFDGGYDHVEQVREAPDEALSSRLSERGLHCLQRWRQTIGERVVAESVEQPPDLSQEERLVIDPGRPDRMMYQGVEVPLTRIQFRLMEVLWRNRGRCVSYDDIMRYVWEGAVVEQNNVIDQKGRILKKLEALVGKPPKPLVRTIRGQGLLLE